jgi:hypothetical protein
MRKRPNLRPVALTKHPWALREKSQAYDLTFFFLPFFFFAMIVFLGV